MWIESRGGWIYLAAGQAGAGCGGPPAQQPGWALVFMKNNAQKELYLKSLILRLGNPDIANIFCNIRPNKFICPAT